MNEYAKGLAIVKRADNILWELGDWLIEICPSGARGNKDGSLKVLDEIADYLTEQGYPQYSRDYLRRIRRVSEQFPNGNRFPLHPWSFHDIAGSPTMMQKIIDRAETKKIRLSQAAVKVLKQEIQDEEDEEVNFAKKLIVDTIETAERWKPYVDLEIQFQFGQEEKDKLKHELVKIMNMCQVILRKLGEQGSHLRAIGGQE